MGALFGLAGLLLGPPIALVRLVGNPLPAHLPAWSAIVDASGRTGVSDEAVIKVLAVLAWVIWAQLAAAIAGESLAVTRRRPSFNLPVLPGLQVMASQLVAAVVLLTAPALSFRTEAPLLRLDAVQLAALIHDDEAVADVAAADDEPRVVDSPVGTRTLSYLVRRHDSFWSIAEEHLGDGMRWREIRELNVGRPQPDGRVVASGSDLIVPGWELLVPVEHGEGMRGEVASVHIVEKGDNLWAIAADALGAELGREASDGEVGPYWRDLIELNRDKLADPGNPGLVFAGQVIALPGASAPATGPLVSSVPPIEDGSAASSTEPAEQGTSTSTTAAPAPSRTTSPGPILRPAVSDEEDPQESSDSLNPLLGIAATGLAAGVVVELGRRRRARRAAAAVGSVVPRMPAEMLEIQREVLLSGDLDAAEELRSAMAELASHLASGPSNHRPRLVQLGENRVEVLLDEPDRHPPEGWAAEAAGAVWSRDRPVAGKPATGRVLPALVTVGRPADGTEILFDLEAAGVTLVAGDRPVALDLVRSMVHEVLNGGPTGEVEVVIVGRVIDVADERVRHVESWDELADEALAWGRVSRQALRVAGLVNPLVARGSSQRIDGTVPLVVVTRGLPPVASFENFCELATGGAACCVLAIAEGGATIGTTIRVEAHVLEVPSLGLVCEAQQLAEPEADRLEGLLAAADAPAQPATLFDLRGAGSSPGSPPDGTEEREVLVRVLGEIRVEGGHRRLTPKQLGLLTYIALHPGSSADRVEQAVWPDLADTRRDRLHVTLSQVRAALGAQHLPSVGADGTYRCAPSVGTDLELFNRCVAAASRQPPEVAVATLKGALDMVDGPVFDYRSVDRRSFVWVDLEHWIAEAEAQVVEIAWKIWHLSTEAGDTDGAVWAARRGLLASPANTELTNALMRAYVAAGDTAAAQAVFESHVRAMDRLGLGEPEWSTVEVWESLRPASVK